MKQEVGLVRRSGSIEKCDGIADLAMSVEKGGADGIEELGLSIGIQRCPPLRQSGLQFVPHFRRHVASLSISTTDNVVKEFIILRNSLTWLTCIKL